MSEADRFLWGAGDVVLRQPTDAEIKAMGASGWIAPATPPSTPAPAPQIAVSEDNSLAAVVREHGELGPVLVNADQHFTTESQALA